MTCLFDRDFMVKKHYAMAEHFETGAKVPIEIISMKDNQIQEYREVTVGRKGFTLLMLQERWGKSRDETLELLQKHKVPAHVNYQDIKDLVSETKGQNSVDLMPVDFAIFFEEYIYGIEKMLQIAHRKLKSKKPSKDH